MLSGFSIFLQPERFAHRKNMSAAIILSGAATG